MHLRLRDSELTTLVEMLSLAANVASWNQRPSAEQGINAYEALESKVLEIAAHSGLSDWIEYDHETSRFRVKPDVEDGLFYRECYDEFRNESFWDELTIRLADRDLQRAIGMAAWERMSEEERREHASKWEKRYWDEFHKRGVDHLVVVAPPGEG